MKQKVLFVATVLRGHILVFHLPYMQWFQQQGYEVHVCARNDTEDESPTIPYCDRYIPLPFERSPLSPGNARVYRSLKALIDQEAYVLVHCHTPVGGMMGRLCARGARKRGTRVVYTAHGFHFYTGAKAVNWLLYYPAERLLARFTDLLITINQEDYARAKAFKAKQVALVHGVGVELSRFEKPEGARDYRRNVGIPLNAPLVITVGEHIPRKNHETVLRALAEQAEAWLLFCGTGERENQLKALAGELGMEERVRFLGFRQDVPQLLAASDVFFFPSWQEGLPVSLMEAMAAGLPCVVSNVRGNRDLIARGQGGMLREPEDAKGFGQDVAAILADEGLRERMGEVNLREIQAYGLPKVLETMAGLYQQQLMEGARQG